ncbi:hypothetical protein E4U41_001922 [Claviceps citrina]|nr:hypothetical protein E4U41_001922 [Claviceps citrina]
MPPPPPPPPPRAISPAMGPAIKDAAASSDEQQQQHHHQPQDQASSSPFPRPKLRLECRDMAHPGANLFFSSVHASETMIRATADVLRLLYPSPSPSPSDPTPSSPPPTRSVTLILRDMPGVAYTTGSDLDNDHKEVHLSLGYISGIDAARTGPEITGVITHELVHCLQWNAEGTCPGGLIEGVADWVRLRCHLDPPHWKRGRGDEEPSRKWDAGYQHTAYFLEYLEQRFGPGFVPSLNERLRVGKYHEETFWPGLTGSSVGDLFQDYVRHLKHEDK